MNNRLHEDCYCIHQTLNKVGRSSEHLNLGATHDRAIPNIIILDLYNNLPFLYKGSGDLFKQSCY